MNREKTMKTIFIFLFIMFIGICISNKTGYYEYELHKRVELTNEQIEKFEEDVKNNKKIDIEDYNGDTIEDYSNSFSNISASFSNLTSKYIKKGINGVFNIVEKMIN